MGNQYLGVYEIVMMIYKSILSIKITSLYREIAS